ncbi:peptidoglycan-binding protein [Metabacillus herbersteinensis]|uniref:Peptidoglycan-binding protein n=1 Tax=Metabacillus herbersteinensis TaxID=283816 RepID=A0ABV6GJF5_9BACI
MFIDDVREALRDHFGESSPPSTGGTQTVTRPSEVKSTTVKLPIREGDTGAFVRDTQRELISAGFSLPRFGADGQFGEETENAVMRFQKRYNLLVDGLVGPQTLNKLQEVNQQRRSGSDYPLPTGVFRRGSEGEAVRQIQRALKQLRYDPGVVDGIYGQRTEDAIRRFQSMFAALKDDGVYGPNTRKYIRMELDD